MQTIRVRMAHDGVESLAQVESEGLLWVWRDIEVMKRRTDWMKLIPERDSGKGEGNPRSTRRT